jgi:hypothetical protein
LIFDYPIPRTERRHGPAGYASYKRFRPWLRDEFDFRCVYCLKREKWGQVTGEFDIDHFEPQRINPKAPIDYLNLVYACRRCNLVKLDQAVAVPFPLLDMDSAAVLADGTILAQNDAVRRLILQLDLNSPTLRSWRVMWMRIVALAEEYDQDLFERLVSLPDELPDLIALRPPDNSRGDGVQESWFVKRSQGQPCLMP